MRRRIAILPSTRIGWWAVGLAAANVALVHGWSLMGPLGAFPGFACGLAGGVVGLIAIFRHRERAVAVFAAVVPLLLVAIFIAGELLIGHD